MNLKPLETPRFVRKTQLAANEYRRNFHQIDREVMSVITSVEADRVTPLMSKIYLRLVNAPEGFWEREGVLRIEAELRDEKLVKAWAVLCELVGVASATASKAMRWMHEQGIIGYFSGKNGVGLRMFLNRATSSIGVRAISSTKKILAFPPASTLSSPASPNEAAFNDSFAVRESLEKDINPGAPKSGADQQTVDKNSYDLTPPLPFNHPKISAPHRPSMISLEDVVARLRAELEPVMHLAARQAASREHERTREWLESRGLPKAARVAQHEAYNVLRKHGIISDAARTPRTHADVGRSVYTTPEPHPLTSNEIDELAEACIALLETKGQPIDLTLSEMSVEAGGLLLPEDAPHVRAKAEAYVAIKGESKG